MLRVVSSCRQWEGATLLQGTEQCARTGALGQGSAQRSHMYRSPYTLLVGMQIRKPQKSIWKFLKKQVKIELRIML